MALIYNAIFDKNTRKLSFEDKAGNEIYSFTVPERAPAVDRITKPLTFKATQDGSTVTLKKNGSPTGDFQTSNDGGNTWTDYTLNTAITINTGDKVSFRAKSDRTTDQNGQNYFSFEMTGKIEAWHNVMSMLRTNDFATCESVVQYAFNRLFNGCTSLTKAPELPATTLAIGCYYHMFEGCTSLTEAPELPATTLTNNCYEGMFSNCASLTKSPVLPATTLTGSCYQNMFDGCTSLTEAPVLPATTLAQRCYQCMFYGCTSLTEAPILPVTTLYNSCYYAMFNGCTSLTKAPDLPATTLANLCYDGMFWGCTSLTKSPELPATTLANFCYNNMFKGCTSLTEAPVLSATTLANHCYQYMFKGCSSLNEVHCKIPSTISAEDISSNYASYWLSNVSSTGTFYTNADANWPSGVSGIPEGWNRVNEVAKDDITKPLTFKATQDGSTVKLTKSGSPTGSFQASIDGGNTWTDYTIDTVITLNTGGEVSFRTSADRTSEQTSQDYFGFQMTGEVEAWHNVMSMYRKDDFATYNTVVNYAFQAMFSGCISLTKAPVLPATTLGERCYSNMFYGCASLTKAPVLPATTLSYFCYGNMFKGCTSLVKAPKLPTTTLATSCYAGMFYGCTSLTKAPVLPATTLAGSCYNSMFRDCTSLAEAPALPATTLTEECYQIMFYGCTSLTKAPELPATTLTGSCYYEMFYGCTSLTKAPVLPATTLAQFCYLNMFNGCSSLNEVRCKMPSSYSSSQISSYTSYWLKGVSSTGTFYTNADANWPSGEKGIPQNWRRVNEEAPAVDDITKPLTFRATQDGSTVTLKKQGTPSGYFKTSRDGGSTWTDYTIGTAITLNTGEEVSFRSRSDRTSGQSDSKYFYFEMTGKIEAWHNVMSMYRPNDFATYESVANYAFYSMFYGCTSLTKSPVLPATTLAQNCYNYMFSGCGELTKAPVLPATTLAQYCYDNMFSGCPSLTKAPELPATTLTTHCYYWMFSGCRSLKEVRIAATTTATDALKDWLKDVSATGDFYCDPNAKIFPSGVSGIPANWNRKPLSDYPATP